MPYNRIADAVAADACDAGDDYKRLLYFPQKGLQCVCNLGATWTETRVCRCRWAERRASSLGSRACGKVARTCRRSLQWGLDHFDEAFALRIASGRCGRQPLPVQQRDTLRLADECAPRSRWF